MLVGTMACFGEKSTCRILVGISETNRSLRRTRRRREDNIKWGLKR